MNQTSTVFIILLAGREQDALAFAHRRYPSHETVILSKNELRQSSWKSQLRALRQLNGFALLIFTDSLDSVQEPILLKCTPLVHRCRETVLADASGSFEVTTIAGSLCLVPRIFIAASRDLLLFLFTWFALHLFQLWLGHSREPQARDAPLDLAYLCPSQTGLNSPGGALTHITGFLSGLVQEGARFAVFSGGPLQATAAVHRIPRSRRLHLFREAAALSYNLRFIAAGRKLLAQKRPRLLYQRHGRFTFAGAVLSRFLAIPLVLEYNGSEDWIAKYWDPTRFPPLLRLCEKVSVQAASLLVVVSYSLKQQLTDSGIPPERILVNPNAVDPQLFHPHCGGAQLRLDMGLRPQDTVVCFVGTFSYWHGVAVLGQAMRLLLENSRSSESQLRFLLVGDGPLAPQFRQALAAYLRQGSVIFTGSIPHRLVRAHLDAADIVVSPHIPMPDGVPFFGSPTKLFEYMAMGKAIVASALDQIADVLEHGRTALLVTAGDPAELAQAIQRLAVDAPLRDELGRNARQAALTRHTWRQNARRVLSHYEKRFRATEGPAACTPVPAEMSSSRSTDFAKEILQ